MLCLFIGWRESSRLSIDTDGGGEQSCIDPFGDAPLIVRYPERMASLTLGLIFLSLSTHVALSLSLTVWYTERNERAERVLSLCHVFLTGCWLVIVARYWVSQLPFFNMPYCLSIGKYGRRFGKIPKYCPQEFNFLFKTENLLVFLEKSRIVHHHQPVLSIRRETLSSV